MTGPAAGHRPLGQVLLPGAPQASDAGGYHLGHVGEDTSQLEG